MSLTGTVDIGQQLTFNFTAQNFYYNSPDYSNSYVRWWRNTSKTPGGTILKTDYLTQVNRVGTAWGDGYSNSPTSITGNSTYSVQSADTAASTYVVAELVLVNSYHDHYGGTTGTYVSSGSKPEIGNLYFRDNNNREGTDNQSRYPYYSPRIPVATSLTVNATVNNASTNTVYLVRYRIYNNQTGVYWKPFDEVAASSASAAWQSYTPSSSLSGDVATITDYFSISSTTFNGGVYNDGIQGTMPRWQLEIQVQATTPGFSTSFNNPPFNFEVHALSPGIVPTISANPSSGGIPLAVTFTGSLTAFPRAYRINYGDGNYSGWQTFSTNSANPTYSNSYTYTTAGSYSPIIEVEPSTTLASTSVTTFSVPAAPTTLTATTTRSDGVLLNWNLVSGANYYEIYWGSSLGGGPINQSSFADFGMDNTITTNSFLDTTISAGSTRYYRVRARTSATVSGSNSSNWFPGPTLNGITGTRVLITPDVPTGLYGYGNGSSSLQTITLNWNSATNAAKYELYYNGSGTTPLDSYSADFPQSGSSDITSTTFTTPYQSFSAGTTYYWWVRSVSSGGVKSTWSSRATVITNSQSFTVTWNPNGGSVSPTSEQFTAGGYVVAPTPSRTDYTFNGWYDTAALDWNYFVAAGNLFYPPSRNITMIARWTYSPPNLTAPSIFYVASGNSGDPLSVYFSGGSGPYYQIWWQSSSNFSSATSYDASGSSSPVTDQSGPGAGTYYVAVRSVSSPGNTGSGPSTSISAWSSPYAFTISAPSSPATAPGTPATPTNGWTGGTTYPFSWSAPSPGTVSGGGAASISYYNLYVYEATNSSGSGYYQINSYTVYGTSFTYTSPNASLYYACQVSATNTAGLTGGISGFSPYK